MIQVCIVIQVFCRRDEQSELSPKTNILDTNLGIAIGIFWKVSSSIHLLEYFIPIQARLIDSQ